MKKLLLIILFVTLTFSQQKAPVLIVTDADCILTLDLIMYGSMAQDTGIKVYLPLGEHEIEAVSTESGKKWQQKFMILDQYQRVIKTKLTEDVEPVSAVSETEEVQTIVSNNQENANELIDVIVKSRTDLSAAKQEFIGSMMKVAYAALPLIIASGEALALNRIRRGEPTVFPGGGFGSKLFTCDSDVTKPCAAGWCIKGTFVGAAYVGAFGFYNRVGKDFIGGVHGGVFNQVSRNFYGPVQAGGWNDTKGNFIGALQAGGINIANNFYGLTQIGIINTAGKMMFIQAGLYNDADEAYGVQGAGLINRGDRVAGVAGAFGNMHNQQFGVIVGAAGNEAKDVVAGLQISGTLNFYGDMYGMQISSFGNFGGNANGVQIGLINYSKGNTKGVQIGLINYAGILSGVQIGFINIAHDGGLRFMIGMNFGGGI